MRKFKARSFEADSRDVTSCSSSGARKAPTRPVQLQLQMTFLNCPRNLHTIGCRLLLTAAPWHVIRVLGLLAWRLAGHRQRSERLPYRRSVQGSSSNWPHQGVCWRCFCSTLLVPRRLSHVSCPTLWCVHELPWVILMSSWSVFVRFG